MDNDTKAVNGSESVLSSDMVESTTETEKELRERITAEITAEIRAKYEADIDRKVTQAVKSFRKNKEKEKAALAEADEAERAKEHEKALAAEAEREHKLNIRNARLILCDVLADNEINQNFRELIPVDDLANISDLDDSLLYCAIKDRVRATVYEFNELVKKEADKQKALYTK